MTAILSRSKPNSSKAVEKLRALIFSGELGAGTDHLESELADKLGMSRTPVREAVLMLETQGLLEVRPRKGVRIRPISATDMTEIYDVLTELESLAAADAASQGYDREDLSTLLDALENMELSLVHNDRETWAKFDDIFHNELVRLGGNSRVIHIVGIMADQVRRARMITLYMRNSPKESNNDHRALYDAILKGDAKAAGAIHREHRVKAKQLLIELLKTHHLNIL